MEFYGAFFSDQFYVVAINLSGMGDSGHREKYDINVFVNDILDVIKSFFVEPPIIVGHSFGGRVALKSCLRDPNAANGLVLIDVPFYPLDHVHPWGDKKLVAKPHRTFDLYDDAIKQFSLVPVQDCINPDLVHHIAHNSITEKDGGWTWKFDYRLFSQIDYVQLIADLPTENVIFSDRFTEKTALCLIKSCSILTKTY